MAGKGWTTQVAAAAGAAAGTGAAQLGLGYGLGVVVWPVTPTPDDSIWLGSLGWATWIAASATVFGAVIAARLRGAQAPRLGGPWRFALAASAAVGALLTVALVAVPARPAVRADTFAPEMIAGGYAVIGIVLGLVIAYWAVVSRAVAANLILTAGYLWALAATGIVVELTLHRESATYLTSWQFAELGTDARYGTIYWPSALLTLLAAWIIGMVAAWPSVRDGNLGIGTASSGAVGPLLVAASFLVLTPQLTSALGQLESAYLIAPYAVLAGLAGSALMVASGRRSAQRRAASMARIHRPAPPAATGTAAVPAQPGTTELDTPPTGTPQMSAATKKSGRAKTSAAPRPASPAAAAAAAQASDQARASAASRPAGPGSAGDEGEERAAAPSDRPGRWSRLRRGGRAKPSAAIGQPEVTTPDPAPARSRASAEAGASAAAPAKAATPAQGRPAARVATPATPPAQGRPAAQATTPSQGRPAARAATPATPPAQGRPAAQAATPAQGRPAARAAGPTPAATEDADRRKGSKSTVAAPPQAPPIAKINPPREAGSESKPKAARPGASGAPPRATPSEAAPAKPPSEPDKSG